MQICKSPAGDRKKRLAFFMALIYNVFMENMLFWGNCLRKEPFYGYKKAMAGKTVA